MKKCIVTLIAAGFLMVPWLAEASSVLPQFSVDPASPFIDGNGSLITLSSNLDGAFELYTVTNSGSDLDQITFNTADADADEPSINDMGNGIAFSSDNTGNDGIYLTQFDPIFGWVLGQFSAGSSNDVQPDLSGDGTKVRPG